jgi:GNAT superfamily N-acetyltransferase
MRFELIFEDFVEGPALRFARIPWDSELFGLDVVELRLREDDPEASGRAVAKWLDTRTASVPWLAYVRTSFPQVAIAQALSKAGFYPVELTYALSLPLRRLGSIAAPRKPRACLRPAHPADLPVLIAIAGSAFQADRYHQDPHIPASRADARFSAWIAEGMNEREPVFVYEDAATREILGFFHLRPAGDRRVDISLAAVQPRLRGAGIGASMYEAALVEARDLGNDTATTRISAAHLDVVNLFARLGFTFRQVQLTWHFFRQA